MTLAVRKRKRAKAEQRNKWRKLKTEDCIDNSRERFRQALGSCEKLPDDWVTIATVIRETGRTLFGVTSTTKSPWWWNDRVQGNIQRKRLAR